MPKLIAFPTSDNDARAKALHTDCSFIVEAPAGSGKTGLLVQRFLKLLADDVVESPEEVLAVTFTRKATAELRERVLQQLLAAHHNVPLAEDAKPFDHLSRELAVAALARSQSLHWHLLEQPTRLNIQTFDAVAMQIANALPLLSGSGGQRSPVENANALYQLAARRTLLQLGSKDRNLHQALRTLLLHRDGNLADCEQLIAGMLATREQWAELIPLDATLDDAQLDALVRPKLEHALERIVCAGLARALHATPPYVLRYLTEFAHRHAHLPGHEDRESPIWLCHDRKMPPAAVAAHLDHWIALIGLVLKPTDGGWRKSLAVNTLGFKPDKAALDHHKDFIASIQTDELQVALSAVLDLPLAHYPDDQWHVTKALFFILRHALAELKVLFASRGECDFTELALAARQALDSDDSASDLALAAGGRLRHLLIDEMQDTSAAQYEFILRLTRSWDGHSQTLFLVGDPKQSIYLFRAARVERFLRTLREAKIGDVPLTPLRLTANFRSQANLVNVFNDTFSLLFASRDDLPASAFDPANLAVDVPFTHANASRDATQPVNIWHTTVVEKKSPAQAEDQARNICTIIQQRSQSAGRSRPLRIAVLGRTRRHLQPIIAELKSARIAYKAIDLDPLAERPEVLDVLSLTRALLHPADRTAWLAVLHAPWCGLGLADLLALCGDDKTSSIASLLPLRRKYLSAAAQPLLDRAWPVLESAISTIGRTALSVHVERTWRSLGGDAALQPDEISNVLRLLAILRELESDSPQIDLSQLAARLEDLYAEPIAGEHAVELLTIHKAKGLEWDIVLVPSLEGGGGSTRPPLLNWLEFDTADQLNASILLAPVAGKGRTSSRLNRWLTTLRGRRERAELRRVFYVACTRAREELHLFATVTTTNAGLSHGATTSLLNACWPAAEPHFTAGNNQEASSSQTQAAHFADAEQRSAVLVDEYEPLAIAAYATETAPLLQRLPLKFAPAARFRVPPVLRYPDAAQLRQSPSFERPDGSFAVRAFGNVVHRYLQLLATRLENTASTGLLAELPHWLPRLNASLRGEGLPPTLAAAESKRVLSALTNTLTDPTGLWLLSPHAAAANEFSLATPTQTLRVDRTFLAGGAPCTPAQSHLWIIDFKTTDPGGRSDFDTFERAKYSAQLEAYAGLLRSQPRGDLPIQLGLYYPLIPRLIHWPSET